jgi:hypothetical protein
VFDVSGNMFVASHYSNSISKFDSSALLYPQFLQILTALNDLRLTHPGIYMRQVQTDISANSTQAEVNYIESNQDSVHQTTSHFMTGLPPLSPNLPHGYWLVLVSLLWE